MSIQLNIDEMLEILNFLEHPDYQRVKEVTEDLATELAQMVEVVEPRLVSIGDAFFEGTGFAGTCAPFEPREKGPCPKVLEFFDIEVQQWRDMQDD